mmetsp:Transcript_58783/g.118071  ORF Transcript_58783/g.118071 Transcript_58783/m.118071 type:complete len:201 (+) Transcript_58783:58-660(+)
MQENPNFHKTDAAACAVTQARPKAATLLVSWMVLPASFCSQSKIASCRLLPIPAPYTHGQTFQNTNCEVPLAFSTRTPNVGFVERPRVSRCQFCRFGAVVLEQVGCERVEERGVHVLFHRCVEHVLRVDWSAWTVGMGLVVKLPTQPQFSSFHASLNDCLDARLSEGHPSNVDCKGPPHRDLGRREVVSLHVRHTEALTS